jgi:predicted alpha/beta-hydrolase family hydrolase
LTRSKLSTTAGDISLVVDGPKDPTQVLVLAHGAGGTLDSDFMEFFARGLTSDIRAVARFNFAYSEQGRRSPGPPKVSEQTYREVVDHLGERLAPTKMFIGGKSYGGRMASHIAAQGAPIDGLVFLGYPLHAPGRPENIRDAHLRDIKQPMLFVEGTRDPFCPLATLTRVLKNVSAPTEVAIVDDGDHSLKVRRTSGRDTETAWTEAIAKVAAWLDR